MMEEHTGKYMVEFNIQPFFHEEIEELLEEQKKALAGYFYEGRIFSFSIANDLSQMWMIVLADSESEMITIIDSMPISRYCDYDYKELLMHHTVQFLPEHSLN